MHKFEELILQQRKQMEDFICNQAQFRTPGENIEEIKMSNSNPV